MFITSTAQGLQTGILQCYPTVLHMVLSQDSGISQTYFFHVLKTGSAEGQAEETTTSMGYKPKFTRLQPLPQEVSSTLEVLLIFFYTLKFLDQVVSSQGTTSHKTAW